MAVRITQIPVETVVAPSSGQVRVSQETVETIIYPATGRVRMTLMAVETISYYNAAGVAALRQPNLCIIS